MGIHATRLGIAICLTLMWAGSVFSQSPDATNETTAATVADVYVQTQRGIVVYTAAANGRLNRVNGSPFAVSGQLGGVTGNHLISVGTNVLHVYQIESNGGVGGQISEIDTRDYAGHECGDLTNSMPLLDRTGKYFYIQHWDNESSDCDVWQSYKISSGGEMTYTGYIDLTEYSPSDHATPTEFLTIDSTDKYIYGTLTPGLYLSQLFSLKIGSNGVLTKNTSFTENEPTGLPPGESICPFGAAADDHGHLAVSFIMRLNPSANCGGPENIASYSIDPATGSISTTNAIGSDPMYHQTGSDSGGSMSFDGKFLALGTYFYHFDGAHPPTVFTWWYTSPDDDGELDVTAWDKHDHLYALNPVTDNLHVLDISTADVTEFPGSPYNIPGDVYGNPGMIVVPK